MARVSAKRPSQAKGASQDKGANQAKGASQAKRALHRGSPRASGTGRRAEGVAQDDKQALDLVLKLMQLPGRSGQEGPVVEFLVQQLRRAGAPAAAITTDQAQRKSHLGGETGNLILKLPGTVRQPRRLFVAHIDTVPLCVGCQPVRKGQTVRSANSETGLGADNRAGAAVLLTTALALLKNKVAHPPLTFLWPVQEEVGLVGARYVSLGRLGIPRLAFNFDGGAPEKLTIGATGGYRLAIDVRGLASHAGGAPEQGVSAIAIVALAVAELVQQGWHGLIEKGSATGTSNVGVIEGGAATNVVADRVRVRAEARSHDPKFRQRIVREIQAAFRRAARAVRSSSGRCGQVRFDGRLDYESFRLEPDEPCVRQADAAVRRVGLKPFCVVANGGLDANWLTLRGIPTVSMGCGQRNIHTVDEQLDVTQFHQARRIAMELATGLDQLR